jgi:hypothetical protein
MRTTPLQPERTKVPLAPAATELPEIIHYQVYGLIIARPEVTTTTSTDALRNSYTISPTQGLRRCSVMKGTWGGHGDFQIEKVREENMRKLVRPWTEEDDAQLRHLLASGASAARASVAMKRNMGQLRRRASKMGMAFPDLRLRRKRLAEAAAAQKHKEGLLRQQERQQS